MITLIARETPLFIQGIYNIYTYHVGLWHFAPQQQNQNVTRAYKVPPHQFQRIKHAYHGTMDTLDICSFTSVIVVNLIFQNFMAS